MSLSQFVDDIRPFIKPFVIMVVGFLILFILVATGADFIPISSELLILGFLGLVFLVILGASIKIFG